MSTLELRGITKAYPGVRALTGVDFDVDAGEVVSLLGENGAGKSTLMKVIAGAVRPDSGTMTLGGEPVPFGSPLAAGRAGIGIVHQELSLIPAMSIGENVMLGDWRGPLPGITSIRETERSAVERLRRVGLDLDPGTRTDKLRVADRQLVEIAKALKPGVRVLLLDEPTSALSDTDAQNLFTVIRELAASGVGIVYVSHRLPEVLAISDRIAVLRDGVNAGGVAAAGADEATLVRLMIGHELEDVDVVGRDAKADAPVVLRARGLARAPRLKPSDLELRAGEIVTVFGLVGAGRTRLARTLFGLEPATAGTLEVAGEARRFRRPSEAIAAGMGFVGEDRASGLVASLSIARNITLANLDAVGPGPLLDFRLEKELGERYSKRLNVRTPDVDRPVSSLSGGNQQKVLLARSLASGARVLLLDDPVRGVDVGAKEEIFRFLRELADDGAAVLYFTSEVREARNLGDRILVMSGGAVVADLDPGATEDTIMTAAGGSHV